MSYPVANIAVSTDTFAVWVNRTNILLNALSNYIVTVDSTVSGNQSTGSGYVFGTLGADYIAVGTKLRGGNVASNTALTVESNTTFEQRVVIIGAANALSTVGVTGAANLLSTLGVNGATRLDSTLNVVGAANMQSSANVGGTFGVTGAANALSTLGVNGATRLASTLNVTGAANLQSSANVAGYLTSANLTTTTNTVTIGNSTYFVSNGNVGIGNSTPAIKLQVAGSANITGNVAIGGDTRVTGSLLVGSVNIISNSGLSSNSSGLFVKPSNGSIVVSSSGVSVNAAYIQSITPAVTSITGGDGLSGGTISSTGTLSVRANNGVVANSSGLFVAQGTGITVNTSGVHVNSAFIGTIAATSNNAIYFEGQPASYYTNASNITTGTLPWAQAPTNSVNTTAAFTFTGVHTHNANVVLGSSGLSANGSFGISNYVLHSNGTATYWAADDQGISSLATGSGLVGGTITTTGTVSVLANNGIVANSTGVFVNPSNGSLTVSSSGISINAAYIQAIVTTTGIVANNGLVSNSTGVFVRANNGIVANTTGVFVTPSNGSLVVSGSGVSVNAAYIATIAANSATASPTNTFTVGTASYFVSNGNLGIGTSSPSGKLHVAGTDGLSVGIVSGTTKGIRFGMAPSYSAIEGVDSTGLTSYQPLYVGGSFVGFTISGTERVRIDTNGNTGIGTTSPAAKLDVVGTANISGNVVFGGDTRVTGSLLVGSVNIISNSGLSSNSSGLFVNPSNGSLVVSSSGVSVNATYIATITPTSILANNGLVSNSTGTFVRANNGIVANTTGLFVFANNGLVSNSSGVFVTPSNGSLIVSSSGVSVNAAYIATIAPTSILANNGLVSNSTGTFVRANNGIVSNSSGVFVTPSNGSIVVSSSGISVNAAYIGTVASNSATYANASVTNTFTVGTAAYFVSNGNMGVGLTTPGNKIHIKNDANNAVAMLYSENANSGSLAFSGLVANTNGIITKFWSSSTYGALGTDTNHLLHLFTNSAIRMTVASNGNVGVGNTTPDAKLRVDTTGGGTHGRDAPNIVLYNTNDPGIRMFNTGSGGSAAMYVPGGAGGWAVTCNTNTAFDISVDTSGNFLARGNVTAYSDEKLKRDVENIQNALATVMKLRGVKFKRIDNDDDTNMGFIAQEIQKHVPEVVHNTLEGYLGVSYGNITALLVEAIKELSSEVNILKAEINQLKGD